ncbi:SDR family oxidoreductase [Streptomyces acidiscabies]|uniref:SDR family oxidoreductase n=1 Tax=Streptomyces acidiscabies TaxID=42234 RepID=UPI00073E7152|nr:SDR family oxidoreductase [Streptomyces acidiscabies]GAQ55190.1 linear gramicidin synthase subunit D [Streptomyces acidiscabies]
MSKTHVITGSTGLIGAALLLRLAEHTDDEFVCLVRAPGSRLHETLRRAASAYGVEPRLLAGALRRTRIVEGDLTTPFPLGRARVEVWHSAAVLHFRRSTWRTTFRTNVQGTRRLLELARAADAEGFNYLSTAYVAGTATGAIGEVPASPSAARTPYELSKIAAERVVSEVRDMPVRVLRPSVVVGHSGTLAYPGTPSGAYKIQQLLAAYYRAVAPTVRPCVRALPDEPFNIVPVDHVVAEAHELSTQGATGIHHLTNPTPPSTGALLTALFANCQAQPPTYTPVDMDPLLDLALGVYVPFLNNPQHFTRTHPGTPWTPDHETLRAMFRPFAVRPSTIPA